MSNTGKDGVVKRRGSVAWQEHKLSQEDKDKVITARVNMYSDHPFFAQLAQYLIPLGCADIPTAGVTGNCKFYLNPKFAATCNNQDMMFVVAHETMHLVTSTCARMPDGGNHQLWNISSDIAINYLLLNKEHGAGMQAPRESTIVPLYGGDFEKYWGWITEDIYYDLLKNAQQCPGCSGQGKGSPQKGDDDGDGEGDGDSDGDGKGEQCDGHGGGSSPHSDDCPFKNYWWDDSGSICGDQHSEDGLDEEQIAEWKQRVANAAAEARQAGNLPGALGNFITDLMQPKKDWKRELRMAAHRALRKRYDWKKVARRTAGQVRTPGKSPHLPSAFIYLDTSGSMSDEDLKEALAEMAEIVRLGGGAATLILGDCTVYHYGECDVEALKRLPVQRGGTDFRPVFDKIQEENDKPNIFIGFSDLEGPFPDVQPDFPVVWCRPQGYKADAPWGRVIDIELDSRK